MKIVTVAVKKGGVGKTTTATTLASGLARRGYRVLLVDTDPQAHAGTILGVKPQDQIWAALADGETTPIQTGRPGLHILTSGQRTAWINTMAPTQHHISALREAILSAGAYDFAVIDTPPTPSWLVDAALYAADQVVAPIQLAFLGSTSGEEFGQYVAAVRKAHGLAEVEIIFVPTMAEDTLSSGTALAGLRLAHNGNVSTPITRAVVVDKASRNQQSLHEYAPANQHDARTLGRAVQEYDDLISRIDR